MLLSLPLAIVMDGEWSAYVFGIVFGIAFALFSSRRWRRTILAAHGLRRGTRSESSAGGDSAGAA